MKAELHKEVQEDLAPPKPLNGLDLLSALVHELSQPLTVLMGEFELAASYPPDAAEYHDLVERSLTEVNRLTACLIMFRDLAPIPDPQQLRPVSLTDLLTRLSDVLAPVAESQGSRIEFSGSRPISIPGQGRRLQLIFSRLLQKMLSLGGPGCVLKVSLHPQTDGASVIIYADPGNGRTDGADFGNIEGSDREAPVLNPKDPDWVLGRWVAESSGGRFEVAITETGGRQIMMTFPGGHGS